MKLFLSAISPSRSRAKSSPAENLVTDYVTRITRYTPCTTQFHTSEAAFFTWLDHQSARTTPTVILLDSRGKLFSSEDFAAHLGQLRDTGAQSVILAIGPADGWSPAARARASLLLSFGPVTLPHDLARLILAEQLYRALTILAGHPYHSGH